MAAPKVKTSTNSKAELIITIGETEYIFRQPLGRDLLAIERTTSKPETTDTETLATIMATLSGKDEDVFYNMPLAIFKKVGTEVMEYFRASSEA